MQGAVKGPVAGRDHVVLFWLRLPLSEDGERVSKILCHDVGIMPAALEPEAQSDDVAEG
jgi:hypothetical protein